MKLTRNEALSIFSVMTGITQNSQQSISFKANYALAKNIRNWLPSIKEIEKAKNDLIALVPDECKTDTGIELDLHKDIPEVKNLADFLNEEEEFEIYKFDGEGLNSEANKWQSIVKILFPLLNEI